MFTANSESQHMHVSCSGTLFRDSYISAVFPHTGHIEAYTGLTMPSLESSSSIRYVSFVFVPASRLTASGYTYSPARCLSVTNLRTFSILSESVVFSPISLSPFAQIPGFRCTVTVFRMDFCALLFSCS